MRSRAVTLICLGIILISGSAHAGANPSAKVAVHVLPHASRTCAKNFPVILVYTDIITTEPGRDVDAFPVFWDLIEHQGFDYSMTWPGLYTCAFTSCSDLTIGSIQNPGDGISHAWYTCQRTPVAITGWGWIYDTGLICIVPHPTAGGIVVWDCSTLLDTLPPTSVYCAGIGGVYGDDPGG
jgi:hypothetical protein